MLPYLNTAALIFYLDDFSPERYPSTPLIIAVITGISEDVNSFPVTESIMYIAPIYITIIANIITKADMTMVLFLLSPFALICAGVLGFISSSLLSIIASKEAHAASICKADELPEFTLGELYDELDDERFCGGIRISPLSHLLTTP
ncbi:TPA: hypothetical protein JTE47_004937 [Escherichia coli]|nr:hypothetical protein [Escherichia coli]